MTEEDYPYCDACGDKDCEYYIENDCYNNDVYCDSSKTGNKVAKVTSDGIYYEYH